MDIDFPFMCKVYNETNRLADFGRYKQVEVVMGAKIDTQVFYDTLDSLYEKKEMERVEPYMLETLARAGELRDLEGIVSVCNELGGLYRAMRRTEEALWTYEKVLEGLEQLGMKGTRNYASALINLGNVHIARKSYQKAYDIDRQALEILEKQNGEPYQMAALCNNMSAALRELGLIKDGKRMAERAIQIIRQMPEFTNELATSYTNLGQAQAREYDYSDARKNLSYALQLYESCNGDKDIHYAVAVYALAGVNEAEGRHEEAEQKYMQAAKLIERDFGHTCDYMQVMEDLERIRRNGGKE